MQVCGPDSNPKHLKLRCSRLVISTLRQWEHLDPWGLLGSLSCQVGELWFQWETLSQIIIIIIIR